MTPEEQTRKLEQIEKLTPGELEGWWENVHVLKYRDAFPGERAALLKRAEKVGVDLVF